MSHNINLKTFNRSGTFWVGYNILKQFKKHNNYKVYLANCIIKNNLLDKIFSKNLLSNFPKIFNFDNKLFLNNIDFHVLQISKTNNLFKIILRILKIIKNLIFIFLSKKENNKICNIEVFFSQVFAIPDVIPEILKNNTTILKFQILYDCIPLIDNVPYEKNISSDHPFYRVLNTLNKDTYYFCISDCTKNDFLKIAPNQLDETKMFVTHISTAQNFIPKYNKIKILKILKKYNIILNANDYYIFSLCNIDPRKNLIFTIECFLEFIIKNKINNIYFLLGGGHFDGYYNQFINDLTIFAEYNQKIILLGYIDDEDVNYLYSNSLFFVYLSQYEGFGMPPLEAMQAGTPVICSNNSSIPEVVGDAAVTVTFNDKETIIKAFENFFFYENMRKEYILKGFKQAELFSWEKTFDIMSNKIIEILSTKNNEK